MGGVEWQRGTAFGTSAGGSQRRGPGELADLARELTGAKASDCRLVIESIATYHIDRSLEHEPGWGMAFADVEDDFAGCEFARWPACEALRRVDLARIEHRKQLVATSLDNAHLSLSRPQAPLNSSMQGKDELEQLLAARRASLEG